MTLWVLIPVQTRLSFAATREQLWILLLMAGTLTQGAAWSSRAA